MTAIPDWARELVSPLDDKLGLTITELSAERAVGSIPVDGNQQPFGLLHGGASAVVVETLGRWRRWCTATRVVPGSAST